MSTHTKPSEHLTAILSGDLHPEDAPPAIQSWLQFVCYRIAVELVPMTKEHKRERVREYPDEVVEIVRGWYRVVEKSPR